MLKIKENRWLMLACILLGSVSFGTVMFATAAENQQRKEAVDGKTPIKSRGEGKRLREGSELKDLVGNFKITGDRVTFYPSEGNEQYRVLENLNLERVVRVLTETQIQREWNISGLITEFQGANYLLVRRAYITTNASAKKRKP